MSGWLIVLQQQDTNISYIIGRTVRWDDDDDTHFVLSSHDQLDFYSASLPTQQGRHVAPLRHIFSDLEPSTRAHKCCVLSGEVTNANLIRFGLTQPGHEPKLYHTQHKRANHYTTDAIITLLLDRCMNSADVSAAFLTTLKLNKFTHTTSYSFFNITRNKNICLK